MPSFLIALTGLVAPGFAQGLMSQRRAMGIVFGLVVACLLGASFTPWAGYLIPLVIIGAMVDGGLRHRRLAPNIRWSARYALIAVGGAFALSFGARVLLVEAFKIPASSMAPTLMIGDHIFANKLALRWRDPERGEVIVFRQPCNPRVDYIKRVIAVANDTVELRCGVVYVGGAAVPRTLVKAKDYYVDVAMDDRWSEETDVSRYRETIGDRSFEVFHDPELPLRDQARREGVTPPGGEDKDFPDGDRAASCSGLHPGEGSPAGNQHPGQVVTTDPAPADPCKPHRHYVVPPGHVFVLGDNRDNSNDSRYWGSVPVENIKGPATGIWLPFGRIGRLD